MVQHNGNLTQINLGVLNFGDYSTLNFLKNSQQFKCADNTTRYDPSKHDANGYPTEIYGTGLYTVFPIPGLTDRPGNYVFDWEGDGTFFLGNPGTSYNLISGNLTGAGGVRRAVIEPLDASRSVRVTVIGATPPTNWRFYHADDEALINAGEIFSPLFVEKASQAGMIRHLDSQGANISNVVDWADRTPVNHYSWSATTFPLSKYAGVTSNTGDAYTAAKTGFTLTDKAQVILKFNADASGTEPTANIEGTGDVVIRNPYGGELGSNEKPAINRVCCLTYEARLGCYLKIGGDVALGDWGILAGWPPEIIVACARKTRTHPYIVSPYLTVDPLSDYMTGFTQLFKDTLNA